MRYISNQHDDIGSYTVHNPILTCEYLNSNPSLNPIPNPRAAVGRTLVCVCVCACVASAVSGLRRSSNRGSRSFATAPEAAPRPDVCLSDAGVAVELLVTATLRVRVQAGIEQGSGRHQEGIRQR